ncbi:MAG TPA: tryptophan/tyrosine permease [Legionellales bacterium]|nr:tryptophan/tyrosine permease [Legionellales bacterium]
MTIGKFFGSILLIIGTSIGGGMLALPVATAAGGFYYSVLAFIFCWFIMTAGAFLILEVLQPLPQGSNMISLARHYLGKPGEMVVWLFYLALLYSLVGAYISGGTDVLNNALQQFDIQLPLSMVSAIYTLTFSFIIYKGIYWVDYVNRVLMFGKLGTYLILVLIVAPFVKFLHLNSGTLKGLLPNLSILITSFGFASIVPSLRDYWRNDIAALKKIIFWGSLTPLVCYLIWNLVIMGSVGQDALNALVSSAHATSGVGKALLEKTSSESILGLFDFFSCICMLTAFLSVSLGLYDFLADGFKMKKSGLQGKTVLAMTFLPPLALVIVNPGIYLSALNYAGSFCIILLLFIPVLMSWKFRKQSKSTDIILPGQKWVLSFLLISAIFCMMIPYAQ